jgi:hypothetical protein
MDSTNNYANEIAKLKQAVVKGNHADVSKQAYELKIRGADLSSVIKIAETKNQVSGGAFTKVVAALK